LLTSWKSLTKRAGYRVGSGAETVKQVCRSKDLETYQNVTDPKHCQKLKKIKKLLPTILILNLTYFCRI
jgi:hypothetical protein